MRKFLSIVLTVILTLSILPTGMFRVVAITETTENFEGYYTYTVENEEAMITEVDVDIKGYITVPSTLGGYSVTRIGKRAFEYCSGLTSIILPDTITEIGDNAFYYCTSLKNIILPNQLSEIGYFTFTRCDSLESISIPNSVECIHSSAFAACGNLTDISIGNKITSIESQVFYACDQLKNVYFRGTEQDALAMDISDLNDSLMTATWYYNSCILTPEHAFEWVIDYENNCGVDGLKHEECSVCHITRNIGTVIEATNNHNFQWIIDYENNCGVDGTKHEECTICHKTQNENTKIYATNNHIYDNNCDEICNVCKYERSVPPHTYDGVDNCVCSTCSADICLVRFSLNCGTGDFEPIVVEQGEIAFLPQVIPSKAGYRFAGWSRTKNGNIDYYAKNELLLNESVTLWAQWDLICDGCSGDGKILKQTICLSCNGSGNKYETSTCSSCGGSGLSYSSKDCPACNAGWIIVGSSHTRCTSCGGSGSISLPKSCSGCGGQGINRYPYNCTSCDGVGKSYYESDCEECDKTGVYIRSNVEKPNVPVVLLNGGTTVELVGIQNGEYSLDGINWQENPVFDNLIINKEYTFYQRYAKTDTTFTSEASDATVVKTHAHNYDSDCDTECNLCFETRVSASQHTYSDAQDLECNNCYELRTLERIAITAKPNKLTYLEGDPFDKSGIVVTAYYNNNTSGAVTDYTISGYTSNVGIKTITVSYGGKTTTFEIEVIKLKNGWAYENNNWVYYENNVILKNCWKRDSIGWCYLGSDGYMKTNAWCTDSKGWCYVGANGYAVTNCWKKDSYGWIWLDANGSMTKSAWIKDGGKWYYLDANGYMVSSKWMKDSTGWVYLGSNGAMVTNAWVKDSIGWCYVGSNGYAVTNTWKQDSTGKWCYLNANGNMVVNNWVQDGGKWYFMDVDGYMVTGTHTIGGKTYTFNSSGVWVA